MGASNPNPTRSDVMELLTGLAMVSSVVAGLILWSAYFYGWKRALVGTGVMVAVYLCIIGVIHIRGRGCTPVVVLIDE